MRPLLFVMLASLPSVVFTLSLSSPAFKAHDIFSKEYSCYGQRHVLPISISEIPVNTRTLAMVMADPDTKMGTVIHWVAYNLPANTKQLPSDNPQIKYGLNSSNIEGYRPPCPPEGRAHRYIFTVYALDKALEFSAAPTAARLQAAVKNHVIEKATLIGRFAKPDFEAP